MDLNEMFLNCRKGDLGKVKYLVEQKEVEVNVRDTFDSTPLYYACLCGHIDIVRYLLKNGACCEANTFDGERCLYGALNPEIRSLLRNYKVITSQTMRRDPYEEFLRRLLENADYSDVCFVVHGYTFNAHRCILSARSEYFADMFINKWRSRRTICLSHELVQPWAFKSILQYLYTAKLETHIDQFEDCVLLANQCKLSNLTRKLEDNIKKVYSFECTKPGTNVTVLLIEPGHDGIKELRDNFGFLAQQALPVELSSWIDGSELPFLPQVHSPFVDLAFVVDGHHFMCHKVIFCSRSDYFRALLEDHFSETETDEQNNIPVVRLVNITAEVFVQILYYVYQEYTELTTSNAYDVLCAADVYLLPGLKRQCSNFIGQHLDETNVINILRAARLFELPRLEDQSAEVIAKNLEKMAEDEEFHILIKEDAQNVQGRQETDSINIIDDVRYHITSNVQTFSAMEEAQEKLAIIDQLLEKLELDA